MFEFVKFKQLPVVDSTAHIIIFHIDYLLLLTNEIIFYILRYAQ